MNKVLKYVLFSNFLVLFGVGLGLLRGEANRIHHEIDCNTVEVNFTDSLRFVDANEVREFIDEGYGQCIGLRLDEIELDKIENMICSRSYVKGCEAWTTDDGILHVSISQRKPAVRFQKEDSGFYADADGFIFPIMGDPLESVRRIDGQVNRAFDTEYMNRIFAVCKAVESDKILGRRLSHYTIMPDGDFAITDRDGLIVLLGDGTDIAQALSRADRYYSSIKPSKEPGWYKSINVKYKDQIICRTDTQLQ